MVAERLQCREVGRHGMVIEEPSYDLRQPSSLFGNGLVPALSQSLLHFRKLRLHAVAAALPFEQELAAAAFAADEGEA